MTAQLPGISLITPSYNQGRFIERTIRSVLDQSYAASEYWIFDGGSTDETVDILKRYSSQLQWTSEPDGGQAAAVNKGLRAASADIIGWLNSDDIYYPETLARVAALFRDHPNIDVIYGAANHIDVADQVIEAYPTEPWSVARLYETCFLCQPAVFFRRSVMDRWGYLDESLNYCMDYEYWLRLAHGGAQFHHEPRMLAGSRFYLETKTLGARVRVHKEINEMLRGKFGQTPMTWILGYSHVVTDDTFGISRTQRRCHVIAVALTALVSSLRWNGKIGADLKKYLRAVIPATFRETSKN